MSREAMQRLAASGSYIVVTDINVWVTENGGNTAIQPGFVADALQTVED